jgi:hypothetical protein
MEAKFDVFQTIVALSEQHISTFLEKKSFAIVKDNP